MDLSNRVIGIVGGMGPKSGLELFNRVLNYTDAKTDQEHLSTILVSFPSCISDRTLFLEEDSCVNPSFSISEIIKKLENAGAEIIGIACNTSYSPAIYDDVLLKLHLGGSKAKLIHMPLETCEYIKDNYPSVSRIGLMTTNGTYRSGVYKNLLDNIGYEVVLPDSKFQNDVIHEMIYNGDYGIKSNAHGIRDEVKLLIDKALAFFKKMQVDAIILGCTELSLAFNKSHYDNMLIIDSTDVMAKALIREATSRRSSKHLITQYTLEK